MSNFCVIFVSCWNCFTVFPGQWRNWPAIGPLLAYESRCGRSSSTPDSADSRPHRALARVHGRDILAIAMLLRFPGGEIVSRGIQMFLPPARRSAMPRPAAARAASLCRRAGETGSRVFRAVDV